MYMEFESSPSKMDSCLHYSSLRKQNRKNFLAHFCKHGHGDGFWFSHFQ